MTNTEVIVILPAGTFAYRVEDQLRDMTDGTVEVVAFEVFDHADAVTDVGPAVAKSHGVDPGSTLGVWVLGPRRAVEDYVMRRSDSWEEQFCFGFPEGQEPSPVVHTSCANCGMDIEVWREDGVVTSVYDRGGNSKCPGITGDDHVPDMG